MSSLVEGTFTLDGLLEGRLAEDAEPKLRAWAALMKQLGLPLSLQLEGNRFSLMAESVTADVRGLGGDATGQIEQALVQLVESIGPVETHEIFSTLRSVEIQPSTEIRAVYLVRADDSVDVQSERLVAETVPPPAVVTPMQRAKQVGIAVLVLAALYGVTSLFIPYGELLGSLKNRVAPLDATDVAVDVGPFAPWLAVEGIDVGARSHTIRITLRKGDAYPARREELGQGNAAARAMAVGYLRAEVFAGDGTFLGYQPVRIKALDDDETTVVIVGVSKDPRPARIALVP